MASDPIIETTVKAAGNDKSPETTVEVSDEMVRAILIDFFTWMKAQEGLVICRAYEFGYAPEPEIDGDGLIQTYIEAHGT